MKKCGTTDCKLYSKWIEDGCGKMVEGRRVELCMSYTESSQPEQAEESSLGEMLSCHKLIAILQEAVDKYGDIPIYFDVEARSFDYHVARVGQVFIETGVQEQPIIILHEAR